MSVINAVTIPKFTPSVPGGLDAAPDSQQETQNKDLKYGDDYSKGRYQTQFQKDHPEGW